MIVFACKTTGPKAGHPGLAPDIEPHAYALTGGVAGGLAQLLAADPLPPLAAALLRAKHSGATRVPGSGPANLVLPGRRVEYMISGGGAQTTVLSLDARPARGQTPVSSLLGATLLGMHILQKAPLPQENGETATLVVLKVFAAAAAAAG